MELYSIVTQEGKDLKNDFDFFSACVFTIFDGFCQTLPNWGLVKDILTPSTAMSFKDVKLKRKIVFSKIVLQTFSKNYNYTTRANFLTVWYNDKLPRASSSWKSAKKERVNVAFIGCKKNRFRVEID